MTRTQWAIVIFWVVVLLLCARSFYNYNQTVTHDAVAHPEQHFFPPEMLPPPKPVQSPDADVRQVSYVIKPGSGSGTFNAEITIKNFGLKTATGIQVKVQPYHGTASGRTATGPDEIEMPGAIDPLANNFEYVEFPDLAPDQSLTKTVTFVIRSDAEAKQSFDAHIVFQTAKDKP